MNDVVTIPRLLGKRLQKVSAEHSQKPEVVVREAIVERLDYLEWKKAAIAKGQADLDAGRVMTTEQMLAVVKKRRVARAKRHKQAT